MVKRNVAGRKHVCIQWSNSLNSPAAYCMIFYSVGRSIKFLGLVAARTTTLRVLATKSSVGLVDVSPILPRCADPLCVHFDFLRHPSIHRKRKYYVHIYLYVHVFHLNGINVSSQSHTCYCTKNSSSLK